MSIKKSIGWTDKTCNPIKGVCKGGCWYCWTKPFYVMKRLTPEIRLHLSAFDALPKTPKKVFLCSTHDLFGSWISENWRDLIFDYIKKYPQHIFQILTKFPHNIDRDMPDNVWLGVSITKKTELAPRISQLYAVKTKVRFISFEPLLEDVSGFRYQGWQCGKIDWIIVGRLTGHGRTCDPKTEWIQEIVRYANENNISIFLKNNLKKIIWKSLIQEFPNE